MTQYKKDDIKQRIEDAALSIFSKKGYLNTKISDIACDAGVSVGNIYRYYKNKDEIFYSVMPDSFFSEFLEAIRDKISAAQGGLKEGSNMFAQAAGSFIGFMMEHRERIIIIFTGSKGTKYEGFKAGYVDELLLAVKAFYSEKYAEYINRYRNDSVIRLIFESLIYAYGYILSQNVKDEEMADMLAQLNLYHFSGITGLLGL